MRKLFPLLPTLVALLGCISLAGCGGTDTNPPTTTTTDTTTTSSTTTTTSSGSATCGDKTVDPGEECDDGNTTDGDGCSSGCKIEIPVTCGDNTLDTGEECDDGNNISGDGCSAACKKEVPATCGDNKVDPGEQCDDGNQVAGDGCENDCTKTGAAEVVCQTLTPLPSGTCQVTAGDQYRLVVGTVLTPGKIYRGGQVLVNDQGDIVFVGCKADCDADPACKSGAMSATTVTCPQGVITPGLINTHDHITFAQNAPYNNTGERYEHRHEWRKGQNGHTSIPSQGSATNDQVSWAELRFLFGGATSTVGSGGQTGILRNLDRANQQEGLGQKAVNFDTFPLGDSSGLPTNPSNCSTDYAGAVTPADISGDDAYLPHVSEGVDARAEFEFQCLSDQNPTHDVLVDKSAYIHGIGLNAADYGNMAKNGTALIWSPRSNITLYGDTAIVTQAARVGVLIALGTDWMPTGSMNLLREIRCADSLNKVYFNKYFTDRELWLMVTANAAVATAVDDVLGTLAVGKVGDISIYDGSKHPDYRAILDADPQDVALVLRAGKPLYGDAAVISGFTNVGTCDTLDVCTSSKQVCLQGEIGKSYSTLKTSLGNIYPDFFCSTPMNEPSCKPTRPASVKGSTIYTGDPSMSDTDGDGIPNATDNCPNVFNPIRPMDGGKQADADGDGIGDACDVCPRDANTSTCTVFDPNDSDADGVPNAMDNCPSKANSDQADADNDGKGDACDTCPVANPGNQACPTTIYQIKNGTVAVGDKVALVNQLVTGRNARGFYLQIKPGDPDYDAAKGADNSGIFVFDTTNTVKVGDRITISSATVTDFFTQIELTVPVVVPVASLNETSPPPVVVTPAEVTTGGMKAKALESVIVQVNNATVTDIAPAAGAGDTAPINEFVVGGSLRVNDFLYLITPFPTLGQNYGSLAGILDFRNGDSKLELRGPGDVIGGTPILIGFGPALTYTDVGQANSPTFPTPLTVQLTNAPATNTFVAVTSGDPTSLTVVGGGVTILAGQTSAPVLVNGLVQSASVTLTASLAAASLTANVRVIGVAEQPSVVSLTPASPTVLVGSTTTFTVNLDIPAPAGGSVVSLTLNPANAGAVPMTVTVPANALSTTFTYVDASQVSAATITATLGGSMATATLNMQAGGSCATVGHLVISEIRSRGLAGGNDDFIELYNPTSAAVTLDATWKLDARSNTATTYGVRWTGSGKTIPSHGHFLITGSAYAQMPAGDETLSSGITDATSLRLTQGGTVIDAVCYAFDAATSAPFSAVGSTYNCEGASVTNPHNNLAATNTDASIERKLAGNAGSCNDTGDNATDFFTQMPSTPQSSMSPAVP